MSYQEYKIKASDGLNLYAADWTPTQAGRGLVCLVHGVGEHCGRYPHLAAALNNAGFTLAAFDLRGHGKSEGQRGHTPTYDQLMGDINIFIDNARQRFPGLATFLYGHSLGGNLVINYAMRRNPDLAGVIATGPALRTAFEPPAWKITMGKLLYNIYPALSMNNGLELAALSRDSAVAKAYQADGLVHPQISARLALDMLNAGLWALEHAAEFPLPLLLMHGGADRITSAASSREFAAKVPPGRCTLKVWEGFYHEIHNEPEQADVFAEVTNWLEMHLG